MAKKVLVVDDEKLIVKGIRFSLEQDGMEVDCAYDGEEALNHGQREGVRYRSSGCDAAQAHDGFEVCQSIREFSSVPVDDADCQGQMIWIKFWDWSTARTIISRSPSTSWRLRRG